MTDQSTERVVLDIIGELTKYICETKRMLTRNVPKKYTPLEKMFVDTFEPFYIFNYQKIRQMGHSIGVCDEDGYTIPNKPNLTKSKTLRKRGYKWVKGKGAIKIQSKHTNSHPQNKYNLRSIKKQ